MASHLYWHCALDGPASAQVIKEQLDLLCGLPLYPESLSVGLSSTVSDEWMPVWWRRLEKANVARHVRDYRVQPGRAEFPTLDRIWLDLHDHSEIKDTDEVGYFHTKGAYSLSIFGDKMSDWRRMMEHFVLRRGDRALFLLNNNGDPFDAVGCNMATHPLLHFSGNFWWAKASYLRTLPRMGAQPVGLNRTAAEFWIGIGDTPQFLSLFDSKVDHYKVNYGPENYAAFR